jgi:hypothetical protein
MERCERVLSVTSGRCRLLFRVSDLISKHRNRADAQHPKTPKEKIQ